MRDPAPAVVVPNDFEILGEISRGGMGIVYRARDKRSGDLVALKVILNPSGLGDFQRFRREVQVLRTLQHPNIVKILDFDVDCAHPYIALEFIDGSTLKDWIEKDVQSTGQVSDFVWTRRIFVKLAGAVEHAHLKGILHRDLKPENILIRHRSGEPVIIDFGLGKYLESSSMEEALTLTQSGVAVGTPAFMAPEQIDASGYGKVSRASDIWGLGTTLYYCLTGTNPYQGQSPINLFKSILTQSPPRASDRNSKVPKTLSDICLACMNRDQASRPSASEVFERLDEESQELLPPPVGMGIKSLLIVMFLLTAVGVGGLSNMLLKERRERPGISVSLVEGADEVIDPLYQFKLHSNDPDARFDLSGGGAKLSLITTENKARGGRDFVAKVRLNAGENQFNVRVSNLSGEISQFVHWVNWRRTLRVTKGKGGDFRTLSKALKSAPKGCALVLDSGMWKEQLIIDRDIEIGCDAPRGATLIGRKASPIRIVKGSVVLKGLKLRCDVARATVQPALIVESGAVKLINCELQSMAGDAVKINGGKLDIENCDFIQSINGLRMQNAEISVNNSRFLGHSGEGVFVSGSASKAMLVRCQFRKNRGRGFLAKGGTIHILDSVIRDNRGHGVEIRDTALTIRDCEVKNNLTGVALWDSTLTISGSSVRGCLQSGISLVRNSRLTMTDVKACENGYSGLSVSLASVAKVVRGQLNENRSFGIALAGAGTVAEVLNAECSRNIKGGLQSILGACLKLEGVTVSGNEGLGLFVRDSGTTATILKSKFERNKLGPTKAEGGAELNP